MPQKDTFQDLPADKYPRSYSPRMKKKLQDVEISRGGPFPSNTEYNPQGAEKELQRRGNRYVGATKTAQALASAVKGVTKGKAKVSISYGDSDPAVAKHRKEKLGHRQ